MSSPFIDGPLCGFQFGALMNKAAINILWTNILWGLMFSFLKGKYIFILRVEILWWMYIQFYFWTSIPLINTFIPMPVPHCLYYYKLALCFEIRKYEFPQFCCSFSRLFWLCWISCTFTEILECVYFCKKHSWDLIVMASNLCIIISSSDPWMWDVYPFICLYFNNYSVQFSVYNLTLFKKNLCLSTAFLLLLL